MKKYSLIKKMVVAALLLGATMAGAQIVKGFRVPQLNNSERAQLGAETNATNARGQLIFNTDSATMQFWDGTSWVQLTASRDSVVGNEVVGASNVTLIRSGAGTSTNPYKLRVNIQAVGDSLISNPTYVSNFADSIAYYISTTYLGDSIAQYIANNFNNTYLGDTILNYIANNINNTYLGDSILNYITNNISNNVLGDSIVKLIHENAITNIKGDKGIVVTGNGSDSVTVSLPSGSATGQILVWDNSAKTWKVATPSSIIKKLTIDVNANYTTESVTYKGLTGTVTNDIDIVGIHPVITSAQGDDFIAEELQVSHTAKISGNAVAYTVRVKNENIDATKGYKIEKLNLFYISTDDLTAGTAPTANVFVGQ